MSNKTANITSIELKSADVNLDDEQIQIANYTGFNKKNSFYLGGQLKNWYVKEFSLPDIAPIAAKIIQKYNDSLIWQDGYGRIYKDTEVIYQSTNQYHFVKETYSDWIPVSYINDLSFKNVRFKQSNDYTYDIKFNYNGQELTKSITSNGVYSIAFTVDTLSTVGYSSLIATVYKPGGDYQTYYFDTTSNTFVADTPATTATTYIVIGNKLTAIPTLTSSIRSHYSSDVAEVETSSEYKCYCCNDDGIQTIDKTHPIYLLDSTGEGTGWSRGKKITTIATLGGYRASVLYYNYYQTGISVNGNIVVDNIDHVMFIDSDKIYYMDSEGNIVKLYAEIDGTEDIFYYSFQNIIKNRYLLLNTTNYINTIDLSTLKSFSRSCDYNDRLLIGTYNSSATTIKPIASGMNEQVETLSTVYSATIYPHQYMKTTLTTITASDVSNPWVDDVMDNVEINFYLADSASVAPSYKSSLIYMNDGSSTLTTSGSLIGRDYPVNEDPLYCCSVLADFTETYLNYCLINNGSFSFLTQTDQYQNMIFNYYINTYINLQGLFVMQGSIYGITENGYIVEIVISDNTITSTKVVCNKGDFQYIGSTPKIAFLRSSMDRSIYVFSGDQTLTKLYDCNNISEIYSYYNNAASGVIALTTDVGVVGLYDDQVAVIDIPTEKQIYYADDCFIVDDKYMFSPYKKEGFTPYPIVLETKFYGTGNEVKSINDTVYMRLYSENSEPDGQVKVWVETINDKSVKSKEKILYLNKSNFDYNGMAYVRFAPPLQSGIGFRLHVESDFSIMSISISHKEESIGNTSINL